MSKTLDFGDTLSAKIAAFGGALGGRARGGRVQIYLSDTDDFLVAFFGALAAGLEPILLREARFEEGIFAISDENFSNLNGGQIPKTENLARGAGQCREVKFGSEVFYLKTSGSTGEPKLIKKTLSQMLAEARFIAEDFKFEKSDEFLASVSHQNMFGLTFKVFLPLVLGAKVVPGTLNYPESIFAQELSNKIFISSPTMLEAVVCYGRATKISNLKAIISAGARLEDSLRASLERLTSARIIDIYGSTEAGVIGKNEGAGLVKFEPVALKTAKNGALTVSSPWCEPFESADAGFCEDGKITLFGRLDRIIKFSEKRFSLDAAEKTLKSSPLLADCAVGAHPRFPRPVALVVLSSEGEAAFRKSGKKGIAETLKALLKPEFGALVRNFKIAPKIPYTEHSKVKKEDFIRAYDALTTPEFSRVGEGEFRAKIRPSDFYFDGHFSSFPIVPGFMELRFVELCAAQMGLNLRGAKVVENIKFTNFIRPGDEIVVRIERRGEKAYFSITNKTECSNGRISL